MSWTSLVLVSALLLRVGFFFFGLYQDATMAVKYTDIDYVVFTDAARQFYKYGLSPYTRDTYRYTPILAYILSPTAIELPENPVLETFLFSFGKLLFMVCDMITGVLILRLLNKVDNEKKNTLRNLLLSCIWLLNPMVITISTRGSSESVLTVLVLASFYFLIIHRLIFLSALFFGLSVHFKIYPIIYLPSILLFLIYEDINLSTRAISLKTHFLSPLWNSIGKIVHFGITSLGTFSVLGLAMYHLYGDEFVFHSYLYHFIRTDHRHNFSVYNMSLYFSSCLGEAASMPLLKLDFTKFAFVPQLLVSAVFIPLLFNITISLKGLRTKCNIRLQKAQILLLSIFLQTFAFVHYNKVITSQYFIWYMVFLPFYLKNSLLLTSRKVEGMMCLLVWILGQAFWLYNAYNLEFLGISSFFPGLFFSSVLFFLGCAWSLGCFIDDALSIYFE